MYTCKCNLNVDIYIYIILLYNFFTIDLYTYIFNLDTEEMADFSLPEVENSDGINEDNVEAISTETKCTEGTFNSIIINKAFFLK